MAIYAISDLHLSFHNNKPMSIFGENWLNHEEKVEKSWKQIVKQEDTVLMPGDFSWAMNLKDTYLDFEYINKLPGKKILLKGNHDYWWTTIAKLNNYIKENNFENIDFLYNNSYLIEDKIICGTRGWALNEQGDDADKIIKREALRLELSINNGINKWGKDKEIIVCMHYPPIIKNTNIVNNTFIEILKKYNIKKCIYGHLHLHEYVEKDVIEGNIQGIDFKLVSADYLNFELYRVY